MRWIPGSFVSPIGIDVGARYIQAAQLVRRGDSLQIKAVASLPRNKPETPIDRREARHLQGILRRQGFVGKSVVLAMSGDKLLTSILELPPRRSGAPLSQIASVEISRIHNCAPNSFEMSCWDLPPSPRVKDSTHVMAAACTHDDANAFLDVFEDTGFNVRALDVPICALGRACRPMLAPQGQVTAVLDIGWRCGLLILLYQDVIVYERKIPNAGIKSLSHAIGRKFRMDDETTEHLIGKVSIEPETAHEEADSQPFEGLRQVVARHFDAMVEELQAPLAYARHQYCDKGVKRMLLAGGGTFIPGLREHVSSALAMEVCCPAPIDLAECPPALMSVCDNAALTMAIGLALLTDR